MTGGLLPIPASGHSGSIPCSEALGSMTMEATLPPPQIVCTLPKERGEWRQVQQQTIEDTCGKAQWFFEVDKEHDAHVPCLIPGFVFVGIVEDQHAPFGPMVLLGSDADRCPVDRLRDEQAQVQSEHAVIWSPMRRQSLARLQNRKHRGPQPWNALHQAPCS